MGLILDGGRRLGEPGPLRAHGGEPPGPPAAGSGQERTQLLVLARLVEQLRQHRRGHVATARRGEGQPAYQALLIEELARAGVRVEFVNGPRGDSPEDQLLVQFQGMFAEYEKAQLMERYRRGKAYRARSGSVNVLAASRSATGIVARPRSPAPGTRSSSTRRRWSRRCSAATPTTAPPSRTWPAG